VSAKHASAAIAKYPPAKALHRQFPNSFIDQPLWENGTIVRFSRLLFPFNQAGSIYLVPSASVSGSSRFALFYRKIYFLGLPLSIVRWNAPPRILDRHKEPVQP
jgi:hypothetical protein